MKEKSNKRLIFVYMKIKELIADIEDKDTKRDLLEMEDKVRRILLDEHNREGAGDERF